MGTTRRDLLAGGGLALGGVFAHPTLAATLKRQGRLRVALVGTGIRGTPFWGLRVRQEYGALVEFVGLCDINPGRLEFARQYIGVDCPLFTDCQRMLRDAQPDLLVVCTVDATHDEFILMAMQQGIAVLTEKPLTTDEHKLRAILAAEQAALQTGGQPLIIGFNYRYQPQYTRLRELLKAERVGRIRSVDFHWYLNVYHGASYFRRWHGHVASSGSLWVHKATHHFDLLNWWLDSEPVEVKAYGALEFYGRNNAFRGTHCRDCGFKDRCRFYWDIASDPLLVDLYVKNEHHDGYLRDACVWRESIDIDDRMSAQIVYANGVVVNYSLTTYSPYEGMRIAFNGERGRIDSGNGIPWREAELQDQSERHAAEMNQADSGAVREEIMVMDNFGDWERIEVLNEEGGHGGGDRRIQDRVFVEPDAPDPLGHTAGSRDGAMSVLIGVAARRSIAENRAVRISELTDLVPRVRRGVV